MFREIMSACLALERPCRWPTWAPRAPSPRRRRSSTSATPPCVFPRSPSTRCSPRSSPGNCNYGIVPVENSTEGMVSHTLDSFLDSPLKIAGEVEMRISHHLLVAPGTRCGTGDADLRAPAGAGAVPQLAGHALAATERLEAVSSNGEAARRAALDAGYRRRRRRHGRRGLRARAGSPSISRTPPDNTTRFLVIGRSEVPPSGQDKTSIVVSSRNKPGALFALLDPFRRHGVSLTRIDTRPSRTEKWAYVFFIEFEGHLQDPAVQADHARARGAVDSAQAPGLLSRWRSCEPWRCLNRGRASGLPASG
jgi:chorismate mutase/prephenate dehydratase